MKTFNYKCKVPKFKYYFRHPVEQILFFDIETTGFSAARTSLYLIGCAARKENLLIVDQFFAETPADESDVLHAFLDYLQNFDTIITFNGIGFDIPYLTNKCQKYKIPEPFPLMNMLTSIK